MTRTWNNDERTGSWGEYCRSQMRTLETDLAAAGHGGSTAGAAVVRAFAFTFASSGLSNGTGHVVYTPTVGDRWLDGWIEVDSAFDGTTPLADFNQLAGSTFGLLGDAIGGCNMSIVDTPPGGNSPSGNQTTQSDVVIVGANTGSTIRLLPGKFLTADPIAVWVTQNGRLNGSAPGSTMGTGTLVIVTATPA